MPGLKSRMIGLLIRYGHLFRGKLHKDVFDMNTSIPAFRELCEKGASRAGKLPDDISCREEMMGGIKAEWLIPQGCDPQKLVFYVHGGGYVSGSCSDHRVFVAKIAHYTGVQCLVYEYGLAPEHPYPAAIDDSILVYQQILNRGYNPANIVFAGESAGGGLCLALLLVIKDRKMPMPVAAVAISPWTDLMCTGESYKTKNKVSPAPLNSWFVFGKHYAGEEALTNPYISPLYGDLAGLPPLFINAGTNDELYDDGEAFYKKAKAAGVEVSFRAGQGMLHCYPLLAPFFPEATEALMEIVDFIQKKLTVAKSVKV